MCLVVLQTSDRGDEAGELECPPDRQQYPHHLPQSRHQAPHRPDEHVPGPRRVW